jgi:SAM-dependent methyltransferase
VATAPARSRRIARAHEKENPMSTLTLSRPSAGAPDYAAIKERQQTTWAAGDYAIIGTTLQIVGEHLCESIDIKAGERVLDVAAGNGNATLAAARRHAQVTSTDYVAELLERGKERAAAERLPVTFEVADAEALPFADASFDVALSTFGVMFTPDQERAVGEITRVVRPGGRIGFANWTPEGFIGQLFGIIGRHLPPPSGIKSPASWGTEARLAELFPNDDVRANRQHFNFRYRSPEHWLETFKGYYGPMNRAFAALDGEKRDALQSDVLALLRRLNRGGNDTLVVPGEYLEVVVTRH